MIYFLYVLAGISTGILSGLFGIGGGIIIVPTLLIIFKNLHLFPINSIMPIATATSQAAIIFTSASSALAYNKQSLIIWPVFWRFLPGISLGIIFGKILAQYLSNETLIKGFAIFLIVIAIHLFFKKDKDATTHPQNMTLFTQILVFILSICIGILAMFFGIGGGIMIVPTFLFLGLNIRNAAGTSAMCGVFIALMATLICMIIKVDHHYTYPGLIGNVYWPVALIITSVSVFCAPIGVKIAGKFQQKILRKLFSIILTCIATHLIFFR